MGSDAPVSPTSGGVIVEVKVIPRASQPGIAGIRSGALLVRLNAPPVEGAANDELVRLLADALGVPRRSVSIVSGNRDRRKRIQIVGVSVDEASRALQCSQPTS